MAHKIKIKRVPHINRDGSVGTKKDFVVRCKSRGKLCTHEKFSTLREAESHVARHWDNLQLSRRGRWTYPSQRKHTATPKRRTLRQRLAETMGVHHSHNVYTLPELRVAHKGQGKAGAKVA